ncbi:neutrophil cytosol factor 2-like isoform X1 [Glandiceps talaboti]
MADTASNVVINSLLFWDEAIALYDRNDLNAALQKMWDIPDPSAKIFFDIGVVHHGLGNLEAAEKSFESAIIKDCHLAIGHYQLAITYYKLNKFHKSEISFNLAHQCLRGKNYIDYKQLGLRYVLYECEVLYNLSLVYLGLNERQTALQTLDKALTSAESNRNLKEQIQNSRQSIQMGRNAALLEIPQEAIFRPPKSKTANIGKKDYLGKAKVVSSVTEKDEATGFIPVPKEIPPSDRSQSQPEIKTAPPTRPPPTISVAPPASLSTVPPTRPPPSQPLPDLPTNQPPANIPSAPPNRPTPTITKSPPGQPLPELPSEPTNKPPASAAPDRPPPTISKPPPSQPLPELPSAPTNQPPASAAPDRPPSTISKPPPSQPLPDLPKVPPSRPPPPNISNIPPNRPPPPPSISLSPAVKSIPPPPQQPLPTVPSANNAAGQSSNKNLKITSHISPRVSPAASPRSSPKLAPKPKPVKSNSSLNANNDGDKQVLPQQPLTPSPPPSFQQPEDGKSVSTTSWLSNMAVATVGATESNNWVTIKAHYKYTCAIRVKTGTPYKEFSELICKKFEKLPSELNIWFRKEDNSELQKIDSEKLMKDFWNAANYGRITVWCYESEVEKPTNVPSKQVVAMYDFDAPQAVDLSFKEGNIISEVISIDDNWYQGQLHGKTGLFPKTYVKDLELPPPSPLAPDVTAKPVLRNTTSSTNQVTLRQKSSKTQSASFTQEETPTSFGALMQELKTATQRRSHYDTTNT